MNITKDVIYDLFPLYATNECSADTRALVDKYLKDHPQDAGELRAIMNVSLPKSGGPPAALDEMKSLQKARRHVRLQSWLMGLAIFFSVLPFSVAHTHGRTHWLLLESPIHFITAGAVGIVLWILYFVIRHRSRAL